MSHIFRPLASQALDSARKSVEGLQAFRKKGENILDFYAMYTITQIFIERIPLGKVMQAAIDKMSGGKLKKLIEDSEYDTLFHLRVVFYLNNPETNETSVLSVEKNERVTITVDPKSAPEGSESLQIGAAPELRFAQIVGITASAMGAKFDGYSAKDNNCQDFVVTMMNENWLLLRPERVTQDDTIAFVKQDAKSVFAKNNYLRKFTNTLTDIAGTLSPFVPDMFSMSYEARSCEIPTNITRGELQHYATLIEEEDRCNELPNDREWMAAWIAGRTTTKLDQHRRSELDVKSQTGTTIGEEMHSEPTHPTIFNFDQNSGQPLASTPPLDSSDHQERNSTPFFGPWRSLYTERRRGAFVASPITPQFVYNLNCEFVLPPRAYVEPEPLPVTYACPMNQSSDDEEEVVIWEMDSPHNQ